MASRELSQGSEARTDAQDSEDLESEVREMSDKILQYRTTLPEKLKNTFASLLVAQRPVLPEASEPGTFRDPNPDAGQVPGMPAEGDQEVLEKIQSLKERISSNASAMPVVLKRMRECISKIDKLDSQNLTIHPAFKRKRTS